MKSDRNLITFLIGASLLGLLGACTIESDVVFFIYCVVANLAWMFICKRVLPDERETEK